MKTAHEDDFSCSMFQKNVSAFIDDELDEVVKNQCSAHAAKCNACSTLLNGCKHIKRYLETLTPVKVSTGFDFRLKSCIRLENTLLNNPLYRSRLFIRDNLKLLFAVPTVAVVILIGVFSLQDRFDDNNLTEITHITSIENVKEPASQGEDSSEEIVYYVLESVKPKEVEEGIFLGEQNTPVKVTPSNPNLKLISF